MGMGQDLVPLSRTLETRLERLGANVQDASRQAQKPADGRLTTAQYFTFWEALGASSPSDLGLRLASQTQPHEYDLSSLAALHSPDLRTAFEKMARYKRLCGSKEMAIDTDGGNCAILSAEVIETLSPLRILETSLVPGSGGKGEHRGGLGIRRDYQFLSGRTIMGAYVQQTRPETQPWGLEGGGPGAPGSISLNPGRLVASSWGMGRAFRYPDGRVAGALSIAAIDSRMTPHRQAELAALLAREGARMEALLAPMFLSKRGDRPMAAVAPRPIETGRAK